MKQFSYPNSQFTNILGGASVGWKMFVYDTGTSDLASIYSDEAQTIEADNPVIADADGFFASFYWTGTVDVTVTDEDETIIDSAEGIQDLVSTILSTVVNGNITLPAGDAEGDGDTITATLPIVTDFSDLSVFVIRANEDNSGTTNTPNLQINTYPSRRIKKVGGAALLAGDIVAGLNCILVYNLAQDCYYLINHEANNYGVVAVSMDDDDVTLTDLEAAKDIIVITGTLTDNVNLIFPTFQKQWTVSNNTTGNYTVTCKTASGTGAAVVQQTSQILYGDGTNLYDVIKNPASNAEALTGTETLKPIVPVSLKYVLDNRSATTTQTGLVEKATLAELILGIAEKYIDAELLLTGQNINLSTVGHVQFPDWFGGGDGGLILNWGFVTTGDISTGNYAFTSTVAFDRAFPTAFLIGWTGKSGDAAGMVSGYRSPTLTNMEVYAEEWSSITQGANAAIVWYALGY